MENRSRKYYVFTYLSIEFRALSNCLQLKQTIFFDFAFQIFTHGPWYKILHVLLFFSHMIMNLWKMLYLFCGIKIADHRFHAKNIFAMSGKDHQQKLTFFSVAIFRGPDVSFSRWRRCYKSRGSFPVYLTSEVQMRSNAPSGAKIGNKSQQIPRYCPVLPGGHPPPEWPLISALYAWRTYKVRYLPKFFAKNWTLSQASNVAPVSSPVSTVHDPSFGEINGLHFLTRAFLRKPA